MSFDVDATAETVPRFRAFEFIRAKSQEYPIGGFERVGSKTWSSRKCQKPQRIFFRGFPLRVFHFAPAYTQNGKPRVGKTRS